MKLLFKVFLLSRPKEQGFVIPVVIALGLIMTLVGTISIFQSSDEQLTATSQRATAKALAAAEIGVARYRELIDKYKVIATYPACESWDDKGDTDPTNDECGDDPSSTSILSWFKAANIPNIASSCFANPATEVANMATKSWQYVDANGNSSLDAGEVEYRLVDYTYKRTIDDNGTPGDTSDDSYTFYDNGTPGDTSDDSSNNQPFGTLIVEGRVDQAVAQISVDLPIQPGIPTPVVAPRTVADPIRLHDNFNYLNPVLWITGDNEGVTNVSGLQVNGNIVITDTDDCSLDNTTPTTANLYSSSSTPPPTDSILPQSVIITPVGPNTLKTVPSTLATPPWSINDFNSLSLLDLQDISVNKTPLPRSSDESHTFGDNIYYHYVVANGDVTLNGTDLFVRAGRKVILYLDGNLTLDSTVDGVDLNSRSSNNNESYYLEIYGSTNTSTITLRGNGAINIKGLIHAPKATVRIEDDPTIIITGAVWVKDWNNTTTLTNDVLIQADPNPTITSPLSPPSPALVSQQFYNYSYVRDDLVGGTARVVDPVISSPSRWETKQAE
ncbi:MAG: hypothetical protein QNJ34_17645 [Xenococcaceae cyanobacterium MO_188.B29]|nr:hypothetical protein [Xenococcaceae cyanobacterium MO_188.B29]